MSPQVEDMRCEEVLDRLEALIDGEGEPDATETVRRHLEHCDTCARELEHARAVLTTLRELPELDPPSHLLASVRAEMEPQSRVRLSRPFAGGRTRWMAAAAAVVLAALGALTLGRLRPEPIDQEALRAAAEVKFALACVGNITKRANEMVKTRVINDGAIPVSIRGLARTLGPLASKKSIDDPTPGSSEQPPEGSS